MSIIRTTGGTTGRRDVAPGVLLRWPAAVIPTMIMTIMTTMTGCASEETIAPRELSLAAFHQGAPAMPQGSQAPLARVADGEGGPEAPGGRAGLAGGRVIVDSLVGQVNGRPIFANEFFGPIEDQLIALSEKTEKPNDFTAGAAEIVQAELQQVVLNALFLAEAEAQLTGEEQKGLRGWLRQLQDEVVAGFEGSEERARRRIMEDEGRTLDEHMQGLKDQALIQRLIQQRIAPRIIVSWRDIEREYERRRDEFNPPATAKLSRIRLRTDRDADGIADVSRRLAAGESFTEVARVMEQPDDGAWETFELAGGDFSQVEVVNETLAEQIHGLRGAGDTAGPFEIDRTTWWVHVAELAQEPGRDLYDRDIQRQLAQEIRRERGAEEQQRYIASLLEEDIYEELDEIALRLIRIAEVRYGP